MDIARIEYTLPATRHLPPQDRVTLILSLPTADDKAAARSDATTDGQFDAERFVYRYCARVFRGVRGLHRDGVLVAMPTDIDTDGREAWMRANLPMRWLPTVLKAAESEEELSPEDERKP